MSKYSTYAFLKKYIVQRNAWMHECMQKKTILAEYAKIETVQLTTCVHDWYTLLCMILKFGLPWLNKTSILANPKLLYRDVSWNR